MKKIMVIETSFEGTLRIEASGIMIQNGDLIVVDDDNGLLMAVSKGKWLKVTKEIVEVIETEDLIDP